MTCRRAFEIDVPAFVVDPRDPAWDDFRAHYPHCADCAAEVAAWTTLQEALGERHPEPDELLRWNDAPEALPPEARAAIARHVERCASCRDELRALGGLAATSAANGMSIAAAAGPGGGVGEAAAAAVQPHHPSASRAGGRHVERHAFARDGATRSTAHGVASSDARRDGGRRGPVARVLLHPAFAYAALVLVLLLPTVRTALDRDAKRAAFDVATTQMPAQAPAEPQPITGPSRRVPAERDDAADDNVAGLPDDAHVDRTAPRLMRQAPFRPAPPAAPAGVPAPAAAPAPAPAPPPLTAAAPAAKAAATLEEGRLARMERAAEAPASAVAGAALKDTTSSTDGARVRAAGGAAAAAPIRLLPASTGATRTLVVTLPPSAAAATDVEIRVVDGSGGRELRQRVTRARGAGSDVQVVLPAGFAAPVLQVEVYAGGTGPVLQGSVTP